MQKEDRHDFKLMEINGIIHAVFSDGSITPIFLLDEEDCLTKRYVKNIKEEVEDEVDGRANGGNNHI